jgi:hypothetical protein
MFGGHIDPSDKGIRPPYSGFETPTSSSNHATGAGSMSPPATYQSDLSLPSTFQPIPQLPYDMYQPITYGDLPDISMGGASQYVPIQDDCNSGFGLDGSHLATPQRPGAPFQPQTPQPSPFQPQPDDFRLQYTQPTSMTPRVSINTSSMRSCTSHRYLPYGERRHRMSEGSTLYALSQIPLYNHGGFDFGSWGSASERGIRKSVGSYPPSTCTWTKYQLSAASSRCRRRPHRESSTGADVAVPQFCSRIPDFVGPASYNASLDRLSC